MRVLTVMLRLTAANASCHRSWELALISPEAETRWRDCLIISLQLTITIRFY